MSPIWFTAAVRALIAERRTDDRTRIASAGPLLLLGTTAGVAVQSGACGCLSVYGVGLAAAAAHLPVRGGSRL